MKKNRLNFNKLAILPIIAALAALGCNPIMSSAAPSKQVQANPPAIKCSDYNNDQIMCNDQTGVCEFYYDECLSIAEVKTQRNTHDVNLQILFEYFKEQKIIAQQALDNKDPTDNEGKQKAQTTLDFITSAEKIIKIVYPILIVNTNLTISEKLNSYKNEKNKLLPLMDMLRNSMNILKNDKNKELLDKFEAVTEEAENGFKALDAQIKNFEGHLQKNEPLLTKALDDADTALNNFTTNIQTQKAKLVGDAFITEITAIEDSIKQAKILLENHKNEINNAKFSDKETQTILDSVKEIQTNTIAAGNTRLTQALALDAAEKAKSDQEKKNFENKVIAASQTITKINASTRISEVLSLINDNAALSYSMENWKKFFDTITNNASNLEEFFSPFTLYNDLIPNQDDLIIKDQMQTIADFYDKAMGRKKALEQFPNAMLDVALKTIDVGSERLQQYCKKIAQSQTQMDWQVERNAALEGYENDMENLYTYLHGFGFDTAAIIKTANTLIGSNHSAIEQDILYKKITDYQHSKGINKSPVSYLSMFTKTLMDQLYESGTDNTQLIENLLKVRIVGNYLAEYLAGLVNNANFKNIEDALKEKFKGHAPQKVKNIANNDKNWNNYIKTAKDIDNAGIKIP